MNKEALRKELEDAIMIGRTDPRRSERNAYIDSRLAALDDTYHGVGLYGLNKNGDVERVDDGQEGKGLRWVKASEPPIMDGYCCGIYTHLPCVVDIQNGKLHSMTFSEGKCRYFDLEPLNELEIDYLKLLSEGQPAQE